VSQPLSNQRLQVKLLFDTNQAAFGQLLLLLASIYREGLEDLPSQCEPLWDFVDFVTEEIQKASERRQACAALPRSSLFISQAAAARSF